MELSEMNAARKRALEMLASAGIEVSEEEAWNTEIADFGLGRLETEGLEIIVYANTDRYCAKELVMFPWQTCPEHRHPEVDGHPGKQETFRCRTGIVYLYVPGEQTRNTGPAMIRSDYYTVFHQIVLNPGDQYTIAPDTPHWFQAGPDGAIVSEFSSPSTDERDKFTDPNVTRTPVIED